MYLSSSQLDALRSYRYTSGMYGFMDTFMTPFWNWAVTLLPLSLAPNLVTLIALICMLSGSSIVLVVNPMLYQSIPAWASLYCSLCIFLYQTLDAIDGKQARRTGSSSPLGQLFDHGCDSVNVTLLLIIISGCIQTGNNPYLMAGLFVVFTMPFYMANWEEFQTGTMRFGIIGVTEAQFTMMAMLIATAIFGVEVWEGSFLGFSLRIAIVGFATIGSLFGSLENVYKVFWDKSATLSSDYVRHYAIAQLFQFWMFLLLTVLWMISPHHKHIFQYPAIPLLTAGFSFSYVINRLIVANVTHCPSFSACYYVMFPLSIVTCLSWASSASTTVIALCLYSIYIVALYSHFVVAVIQEICCCLNIRPFSITVKTE